MIEGNLLVLNQKLQKAGNFAGAASIDTYTCETTPTLKNIIMLQDLLNHSKKTPLKYIWINHEFY
ncbi:hypothetical protein CN300_03855 [Bacillus thuringiensis]|uniref:hypothetical protein n=1 Tax=Bacillus TaxID=1386 RepID=UPI00077A5E6F|nr:hypothetical protein [Bacillus thuringiensis]KXY54040.1 hypothetical protein AT261_13215 [Bacillus cereus]PEV17899.1 hypothetical protein CN418_05910 [Bacillus thuringiensis]PEY76209.1 hypothetical protein CN355_02485 [Bacillus thuringiensis]PFC48372.1 hypothetical protein CN300_03855 [Bacillus thuringiensis]PGW61350.1 hypothetical protein COE14_02940 [Bacillus thuringiensis]